MDTINRDKKIIEKLSLVKGDKEFILSALDIICKSTAEFDKDEMQQIISMLMGKTKLQYVYGIVEDIVIYLTVMYFLYNVGTFIASKM